MTTASYSVSSPTADRHPVFQGFADSRMSGKEIASILGVTPPTVSKWRKGKARVPAVKLAFLTLILANWLDEMENKARLEAGGVDYRPGLSAGLQNSFWKGKVL